jgi:5-hydroxyisourate hydrolase-like protein (transthyretin family)
MLNSTASKSFLRKSLGLAFVALLVVGVAHSVQARDSKIEFIQEQASSTTIKGILMALDGKPAAKVQVRLAIEGGQSVGVKSANHFQGGNSRLKNVATVTTDDSGRFEFKNIKKIGDYHVMAGNASVGRMSQLVAVDQLGQVVDLGTLKLEPAKQ